VGAAENSFVRGDYIAFLVTEFTSVETAPDKSYSMLRGVTITGREFSIEARWGGLTSYPNFLEKWKATRRGRAVLHRRLAQGRIAHGGQDGLVHARPQERGSLAQGSLLG
jgi:hypothetical protein